MKKTILSLALLASAVFVGTLTQGHAVAAAKAKTVQIVSSPASKPYAYTNSKGKLVGYDIDVAKAIDKAEPAIKLHWNSTEFQSMFSGVDAGRYSVVANDIVKNPAREKKYLFSDKSYLTTKYSIVYNKSKQGGKIDTLADLAGKKVTTFSNGSAVQLLLEAYNKKHPDKKIKLSHLDSDASDLLTSVENGQADATVVVNVTGQAYIKEHGSKLTTTDLPEKEQGGQDSLAYFLFGNDADGKFAKQYFDQGLDKIIKNGTLAKISKQHFGKDYTGQ
ncbi:transporter substrate-binding domain-containing protein [Lacticaseibacillus baoqingensis]|uniref:Transporter substrate-binding domain-containing protein n=1 Tax=Lacticaseibacillus baoqingensis TaxID=2486013 RepID=A0ABW4E9U2_9LACO|nr:transporter substrate-binding domain-containing protein [Lacticaseibacillus baoqingensis]